MVVRRGTRSRLQTEQNNPIGAFNHDDGTLLCSRLLGAGSESLLRWQALISRLEITWPYLEQLNQFEVAKHMKWVSWLGSS